jgi:hypothetical protein
MVEEEGRRVRERGGDQVFEFFSFLDRTARNL